MCASVATIWPTSQIRGPKMKQFSIAASCTATILVLTSFVTGFLLHDSLEKIMYTELNVPISTKSSY